MLKDKKTLFISVSLILVSLLVGYSKSFHSRPTNTAVTTNDGLVIEDIVVGSGPEATKGKTVSINYTGSLIKDHKQFDSSYDRGVPYIVEVGIGHAIQAWDKGIIGMKVGGKRKLTVPAELGYGAKGAGNVVPPNSDLIYEIELISVK